MPLSGTSKICEQCVHHCKQWRQSGVVICPKFTSTQQKMSNLKADVPSNRERMAK
jgi:hypothetical protein